MRKETSGEVPEADWMYKENDRGLCDIVITEKIVLEKLDGLRDDKAAGADDLVPSVEFYLYPTVGTVLIHSVKPELTE